MNNQPWTWLTLEEVVLIHQWSLEKHGGSDGIRDRGLLESALAYPHNILAYGEDKASLAELTAGYLFAIANNHAFVDGNKRTAWTASRHFIIINGGKLTFEDAEAISLVEKAAAGEHDFNAIAAWFAQRHT